MNPVWNETVLLADFCQNDIFFGYPASLYVCDSFSETDSFLCPVLVSKLNFWITSAKTVCTFCKKKNVMYYGVFTNLQKNFFLSFKKCETTPFFFCFFNFEDFSEKLRTKKHNFHFQIAKILNFVHQKKSFFSNFTLVHRHLPNSRETVSSFTAVSLKLT